VQLLYDQRRGQQWRWGEGNDRLLDCRNPMKAAAGASSIAAIRSML